MRFIFGTIILLVLLIIGALIAPQFVDWNKYKPQIINQIKQASGYDVNVAGDISVSVVPSPKLKIEKLTIAAPRKVEFDTLVSLDAAEIQVAILPLLQKKVEVKKIGLISPNIQVEILPDGSPSWETKKLAMASKKTEAVKQAVNDGDVADVMQKAGNQKANAILDQISVERLDIRNGNITFIDHVNKSKKAVSDIDVTLKANSLNGPFDIVGDFKWEGDQISIDALTGVLPKGNEPLTIKASLTSENHKAKISFNGITSIATPIDAQGKIEVAVSSLSSFYNYKGGVLLDGLITMENDAVKIDDLKVSLGDYVANGKISVANIEAKDPVKLLVSVQSSTIFDASDFVSQSVALPAGSRDDLKNTGKQSSENKTADIIPVALTLPMAVDVDVKFDIAGIKINDNTFKGISIDANKKSNVIDMSVSVADIPGQGKVSGNSLLKYNSSSQSPRTEEVVYTDPEFAYMFNGHVGDIPSLLSVVSVDLKNNENINQFKIAQFDLKGALEGHIISLKDSVIKLDDMTVGMAGSYKKLEQGNDQVVLDVSIDSLNLDQFLTQDKNSNVQGSKSGVAQSNSTPSSNKIQGFSVPLDVKFDASIQQAIYNGDIVKGVRTKGRIKEDALSLESLSVNDLSGAQLSAKGAIGDMLNLKGLDLEGYIKTSNIGAFLSSFDVDTSALPSGLKALEGAVKVKGTLNALNFDSNVKAMSGQLDLAGVAKNVTGQPTLSDMTIGLKHPNLIKAIQIVAPDFQGPSGLSQAVNFYTKATQEGKTYNLSAMKFSLGQTSLAGDLSINTANKIPAIRGAIKADKILLDKLLGSSNSSGGSPSKSSGSSSSKERWSKAPIDMNWMKTVDVDVKLSANSIMHGAWNLEKPATDLKIANGTMNIKDMRVGLFGGNANISTNVNASPLSIDMSSTMQGIDLEKLAKALSGGDKLKSSGTVSFSTDVATRGASAHALINALNGKAEINGSNIILEGFDLAKMARGLAVEEKLATSVSSLVDGATSGGQTKFDTLKGDYAVEKGTVKITSMALTGQAATITSTGYADLPNWFINVDNKIALNNVSDLDPFNVKIKGPLDKPSNTFGKNILEDYLTAKIKRKLAKQLPDILGDDVSDKLQKFGILPGTSSGTTPSAPTSNDNTAPSEEKTAPAADPLSKILQDPSNAEDAVKDVLKGLF